MWLLATRLDSLALRFVMFAISRSSATIRHLRRRPARRHKPPNRPNASDERPCSCVGRFVSRLNLLRSDGAPITCGLPR
jgi:hypothetical protein